MTPTIRLLTIEDAIDYAALRTEMLLQSPLAFASSPESDLASNPDTAREQLSRAPDSVIIGGFLDRLVGAVGVYRHRHPKAAHKAFAWGMYVMPDARGQGIGGQLLAAAIRHAELMPGVEWLHLSVSSAAKEARRIYEAAGFEQWGTEPDSLRHGGDSVEELHYARRLARGL